MDLFKWMGVGVSHQSSSNAPHGAKAGGVKPINHADYKQFGLENFGNTCYANAILQSLYFCQPFRELVCDSHDRSNPPMPPSLLAPPPPASPATPPSRPPAIKGFRRRDSNMDSRKSVDEAIPNGNASTSPGRPPSSSAPRIIPIPATPPTLFSALRSLFLHIALNPSDKGTVSPLTFINKLKKENELYRSSMHQDAHEFLNFLLNKIVEDIEAEIKRNADTSEELSNSVPSLSVPTSSSSSTTSPSKSNSTSSDSQGNRHTFVHSLFEGTLTSETRCLTCETVSSRDESFLDLSIDIEQNSSVTACLRQFSASEMLSHKNKFFCDSCGGLQEAEKRMKIKKLPNVLALHLKRFKYQEDVQKYIKLAYRVAFPFELRLFNTVDDADDPDRLYQLFAIVVHIGGGPHHGHYIAIIKAHGTWLVFDDDNVEPIREGDISKYFGESPGGAGYVLFYQAVDLDLASVGIDPTPTSASDAGDPSVDVEAESSGDSEPIAPVTPASIPQSMPSPTPLKLDVPVVLEPPGASSATPTVAQPSVSTSSATNGGGGFFRTLKHSQSIKITVDKKRLSTQGTAPDADTLSPRTPVNGDAAGSAPQPPAPGSPLRHSRSLKGKDGWFSGRRKDKKEKAPPVPVPPLPVDDLGTLGASERATHDGRRPSAPGQLEREHQRGPSPLGTQSQLSHDREPEPEPAASPSPSLAVLPPASPAAPPTPPPPSAFPTDALRRPATSPSALAPSVEPPPRVFPPPRAFPPPLPSSPRMRKMSQASQPTKIETPPAETLRPSTAGAKPKRMSRKMSMSGPLGGIFGRKDKDKERSVPVGRSQSATAEPLANDTSRIGRAV